MKIPLRTILGKQILVNMAFHVADPTFGKE